MGFRNVFLKYTGEIGHVQLDFLDSIDFTPFMKNGQSVEDIMDTIAQIYNYTDKVPEALHGHPFDNMDNYEFASYLVDRYPKFSFLEQSCTFYSLYKNRGC